MNALLYNPEVLASYCGDATGRVVIFAFARASGIIMSRLLEAHAAYVRAWWWWWWWYVCE